MTLASNEPACTNCRDSSNHAAAPYTAGRVALDRALEELSHVVFASLPRADQRHKCLMYLRGLLEAPGRKSVRNIAASLGDEVNDQSLHHFINESTWEWGPMREALIRHLARRLPIQACVLHPVVIPKSGTRSVGVSRMFSSEHGQAITAQQAIGVWGVSPSSASPLNWWLHLPPQQQRSARGNRYALAAAEAGAATLEDSMVSAYREIRAHVPHSAVLLNAEQLDGIRMITKLNAAELRHISRIASDTWLLPNDPALPGWGGSPLQAEQIAQLAKANRKHVPLPPFPSPNACDLVTVVRVRLPARLDTPQHPGANRDFLLLGTGRSGTHWPQHTWLTDMSTAADTALLRVIALGRQVEQRGVPRAEHVGIRDFVGRSFAGWHRHATLASVAHAATELAEHSLNTAYEQNSAG